MGVVDNNYLNNSLMRYESGIEVKLGDKVTVNVPDGDKIARVVMLGDTYESLLIDKSFLDWVSREHILRESAVVIEWISENPFEHNNPKYAPVGNYMFTDLDFGVIFLERGV